MHDTVRLEGFGVPSVAIATREFMAPARIQAGALGRPGFEPVYVEHPIQDQTVQQIASRADCVAAEIVAHLTVTG